MNHDRMLTVLALLHAHKSGDVEGMEVLLSNTTPSVLLDLLAFTNGLIESMTDEDALPYLEALSNRVVMDSVKP